MDTACEITGVQETLTMLQTLDAEMQVKTLKKAMKAGAAIIKTGAEADAPKRSGLLTSNITIRSQSKPSKGIIRSTVGVGKKDWTGETFYASFVLWGHMIGKRSLGSNRKQVPGNEFSKKATQDHGEAAANAIIETIAAAIEKQGGK